MRMLGCQAGNITLEAISLNAQTLFDCRTPINDRADQFYIHPFTVAGIVMFEETVKPMNLLGLEQLYKSKRTVYEQASYLPNKR